MFIQRYYVVGRLPLKTKFCYATHYTSRPLQGVKNYRSSCLFKLLRVFNLKTTKRLYCKGIIHVSGISKGRS